MRKWVIAVIIGVLLPYPIILLMQYLAQLQADTGNVLYGYAQSALIFLSYFFLGVFLAALQKLRSTGRARRFRWSEFALGALLLVLTAIWKLEQATGLITAIGFVAASDILTKIVTFNDGGLYLWVVMAGYFMTDAFGKAPAQVAVESAPQAVPVTAAAAETTSVRRSERKRMAKQANARSARAKRAASRAATPAQPQPAAVGTVQAAPMAVALAQPQPGTVGTVRAASMAAVPTQPQPATVEAVRAASMAVAPTQPQPATVETLRAASMAIASAQLQPGTVETLRAASTAMASAQPQPGTVEAVRAAQKAAELVVNPSNVDVAMIAASKNVRPGG